MRTSWVLVFLASLSACAPQTFSADGLGNTAPVAVLAESMVHLSGAAVQLDGSRSYDPDDDEIAFHWRLEELPAGSQLGSSPFLSNDDRNASFTEFQPDETGVYVVTLNVSDEYGSTSPSDRMILDVRLAVEPPVADAGLDSVVLEGESTCLDGSGSQDPTGLELSWSWILVSRPELSELTSGDLLGSDTMAPCFVPDSPGEYLLGLEVSNGVVPSEPDYVVVTATSTNLGPFAAIEVLGGHACDTVQLDAGLSTDPDGDDLSYAWQLLLAPPGSSTALGSEAFDDPSAQAPSFYADLEGDYIVQVVVGDGLAWSEPAMRVLTLGPKPTNEAPIVGHSPDAYMQDMPFNCNSSCASWGLALDAHESFDPDGDLIRITWEVVSGAAELSSTEGEDVWLTVAAPPGTCWSATANTVQVAVTATDCAGASSTSTSTVVYVCGNL